MYCHLLLHSTALPGYCSTFSVNKGSVRLLANGKIHTFADVTCNYGYVVSGLKYTCQTNDDRGGIWHGNQTCMGKQLCYGHAFWCLLVYPIVRLGD